MHSHDSSTPRPGPDSSEHPDDREAGKTPKGAGEPAQGPAEGTHFPLLDRRLGLDRRQVAARLRRDEEDATGLERRRGPGRRRSDFTKAAEEGEMSHEQFLFLMAVEAFKKSNNKMYPTWTDILEVIRMLGYRKTMPSELKLRNAEDWREAADTPANTRTTTAQPIPRREAA